MIKWKLPDTNEPGFLRRRRELTRLLDLVPTPENTDKLVDFLVPFVVAKKGTSKKDQLLDVSQVEYGQAIVHLLGYGNSVPDPKDVSSVPR